MFCSVKTCSAQVTFLDWDQSGHYLLIGDTAGNAEIWTNLTHLLDEWTRVALVCIPDEPIQAGIFFCDGKRVLIQLITHINSIHSVNLLCLDYV